MNGLVRMIGSQVILILSRPTLSLSDSKIDENGRFHEERR